MKKLLIALCLLVIAGAGGYYYLVKLRPAAEQGAQEAAKPKMTVEEAKAIAFRSECYNQGTIQGEDAYNESTGTWWLGFTPALPKEGCNPACVVFEDTGTAEINWRCTGLSDAEDVGASSTDPVIEVNRVTSQHAYIRSYFMEGGKEYVNVDPFDFRSLSDGSCTDQEDEADGTKPLCGPDGYLVDNPVYELLPLLLSSDLTIERVSGSGGKEYITLEELKAIAPEPLKTMLFRFEMEKGEVVRIYEISAH